MDLKLTRKWLTLKSTIGELTIDGKAECFILEDRYREPTEPKVFGLTAIPCGRYRVRKTFSPRFQRNMYLIEGVPGYAGVRIHAGNKAEDTEGCLLPGKTRAVDAVGFSVVAVQALEAKLDAAKDPIWITIVVERA